MSQQHAQLDWTSGQPHSTEYDDIYFSVDNGLEETHHVFLAGNRLHERWQQLADNGTTDAIFTIAETGFGTGLNFLCAWQAWNAHFAHRNLQVGQGANPNAGQDADRATPRLHFISTELHPLTQADLAAALALWPKLAPLSSQLVAQYQYIAAGWHRLEFDAGRVTLTLLVGEVASSLPQLRAKVDAWFLDGFSPAKNPAMWQPSLYAQMARLSLAGTTFSTFTSAGMVRRGLQEAGFQVTKVPGFGRKREMLSGKYAAEQHVDTAATELPLPIPSSPVPTRPVDSNLARSSSSPLPGRRAIVIGGGIAGCASSHALARRGWQVTLIERHAALAQEASGNPVGIVYPRLAAASAVLGDLAMAGYLHTLRLLHSLGVEQTGFRACGVMQLGFEPRELARIRAIATQDWPGDVVQYLAAQQASQVAGLPVAWDGLYFPAAGWLDPVLLCKSLATHAGIQLMASTQALNLIHADGLWQVIDDRRVLATAEVVIIASATDSMQFSQTAHCLLAPVRGQVSMLPQTAATSPLKTVLCTDGYISPAYARMHCLGATFSPGDTDTGIRSADHAHNLTMLQTMLPGLIADDNTAAWQGRAAVRSTTQDYLPVAGPLLDPARLIATPPRHTAAVSSLPWLPGLYINAGHGSKGLVHAPLCAELLASAICGEPMPVPTKLLAALDPNRFLLRSMGLKRLIQGLAAQP